jgi:PP-loop superfamily ATP-utilizing enzyme
MDKIDSIVKNVCRKKGFVETINKMIAMSRKENNCFLCKTDVDRDTTHSMAENFNIEETKAATE